jgi:elongation factor G
VKVYESKDIRNVGVVGHGDSGKTTLTAGLLFTAGATNRLLRVDEGNTITDLDEEEIQRKITISTAIAVAHYTDVPDILAFVDFHGRAPFFKTE